jgi:hypothetical protein
LRILAAALAGANRMSWPYFLFMNALGGICWVLLLGGGAYLFGEQMKRVAGPVQLILLIVAIGLAAGSIIFFRHHEKELVQRAERSLPGPLLGAPLCARDVADGGSEANNIGASTMTVHVEAAVAPKISVTT